MQGYNEIEMKFDKSRKSLLSVVTLSALNVFLILVNATISFPFSAILPTLAMVFGKTLSEAWRNNVFLILGGVIAVIVIAFYGMCYWLSKKHRAFILVAFIIFIMDSLALFWLVTISSDVNLMIEILFHIWVLYSLAIGVKAWFNLRKMLPPPPTLPAEETVCESESAA